MDAQWADMLQAARFAPAGAAGRHRGRSARIAAAKSAPAASIMRSASSCSRPTTRRGTSLVHDYIRQELARIMGIEPASLEIDQPLSTFGLDSLLAWNSRTIWKAGSISRCRWPS